MNILLINHYAGSLKHGMEYRPYYLAREWMRLGHSVTIVAASVSHVRTVGPIIRGPLTRETVDGVNYCWLETPGYQGNGIKRGLNILAFVAQLYRFAGSWIKELKPDMVITSSTHPLDNLPGKWIARWAGARLIYEVHDLWPLSLIELGSMSPRHPFIRLLQWSENYAYRNADHVVSLLPEALPYMQAHGLTPEKYSYIPNGIDPAEWESQKSILPAEHQQVLASSSHDTKLLIGYTGAHGIANALDTVLDAARLLRDEPVRFVLVGQGSEKTRLQARCLKEGMRNVMFLPPVAKAAMPALLAALDVLYIGLKSESLFRFGVSPNKLIDYLMAGKPILYAVDSGNKPVTAAQCGISIAPENPSALAEAVRQLLATSQSELEAMGARGHKFCLQYHDYHVLASQFLKTVAERPAVASGTEQWKNEAAIFDEMPGD